MLFKIKTSLNCDLIQIVSNMTTKKFKICDFHFKTKSLINGN